jgi:hypothetical protein
MFALSSALTPVTAGLRLVTQGRGAPSRAGSTVSASRYVLRSPAASAVYGFVGLPWAGDVAAGYQPRMDKLRMNSSKWNCWPRPVASSGSLHPVACHSGEIAVRMRSRRCGRGQSQSSSEGHLWPWLVGDGGDEGWCGGDGHDFAATCRLVPQPQRCSRPALLRWPGLDSAPPAGAAHIDAPPSPADAPAGPHAPGAHADNRCSDRP